jgi:hypothetical protein
LAEPDPGPISQVKEVIQMDRQALLALWKLEDMPACEEGMMLAQVFSKAVVKVSTSWVPKIPQTASQI